MPLQAWHLFNLLDDAGNVRQRREDPPGILLTILALKTVLNPHGEVFMPQCPIGDLIEQLSHTVEGGLEGVPVSVEKYVC